MDKGAFADLEADLRARSRDIARIGERVQGDFERDFKQFMALLRPE